MPKILWLSLILAAATLLLAACGGAQRPDVGAPGQVSLVFFYTEA